MGMSVNIGGDQDEDGGGYKPLAEINVTPFVDVMLVLLIIFMVAAPLMVQGVPVDLPKTSATKLGQVKKPIVVTLTGEGTVQLRDEFIPRERLVARLRALKAEEGENVVYVRADRKIAYGDVMEVLGVVGEAGFQRMSLLSQPSPQQAATPVSGN